MTIYLVTLKTTAQHDAEKRADLNSFLKTMKRTFGLKCTGIVETETVEPPRKSARAKDLPGNAQNEPRNITKTITAPEGSANERNHRS